MNFSEKIVRVLRDVYVSSVPEPIVGRIRGARKNGVFRQAGVVFVHVPRSAGTSFCQALYGGFLGHLTINNVLKSASPDVLALPRFAIVRNPWDRAVSAYHYALGGGGIEGIVRIRHPATYRKPEFESFERFVTDWLAHKNLVKLDVVFQPQSFYVRAADGSMPFDHIGRFEDINQTVTWLQGALPGFSGVQHTNSSRRSEYAGYYTPKTRDLIARLYAEDIKLFGYTFEE
ncbi:sulfotransferase family 2 domain-containing protein [Novosphingobium sp. Fuku2-ISO-50]|uniref:sulfotransferase family 2 domain-containing protein n=1 Tax=Novosphingobium sp. Fuku2-ISO-50 TaxID=1739114 RepID=UPI0018D21C28|nr:sulfotransferase family 2 domain-containing protein [Novosphingobium sp. Fuku2-ISO-50]